MHDETKLMTEASTPESAGISSSAVLRFLDHVKENRVAMHGFIIIRHNRIAAEGYWPPFSRERLHRMYSASKSMVSLAVGCLIDEGKLALTDPIVDFFPDMAPADGFYPYTKRTTIRDLLMMATPHTTNSYTIQDHDWVRTFFQMKPSHPPGMVFSYDTAGTVVLSTLVERLCGMPFLEYLRPRLLDPIGFSKDAWCIRTPEGTSWGGSGVICTLRDMASLGLLCMNKGRWNNRQLISCEYIEEATSRQIDNFSSAHYGYGYQIWMEKEKGFSFKGMGSQFAYCWPHRNFLFACIADTQGITPKGAGMIDALQHDLYDTLSEDETLPEDPEGAAELCSRISRLSWETPSGNTESPIISRINGVRYKMENNPMGIREMWFSFKDGEGTWEYTNAQGKNSLKFGLGKYVTDLFPQRNYFGRQILQSPGIRYECSASAAWADENKLNLLIYITDIYLGSIRMTVAFADGEITVFMQKAAEWFLDEYSGFAAGRAWIE